MYVKYLSEHKCPKKNFTHEVTPSNANSDFSITPFDINSTGLNDSDSYSSDSSFSGFDGGDFGGGGSSSDW